MLDVNVMNFSFFQGHTMAKALCTAGIQTTLIQDCAVFPIMSRVNKVIIGTKTVVSNGGIKTFVGAASLASAAKFYSVPVSFIWKSMFIVLIFVRKYMILF